MKPFVIATVGDIMPSPKMSKSCEYVVLYGKRGMRIADEIKVANSLTLRKGDYPELSR